MDKQSFWNGHDVHGDVKELDYIAAAEGMINLDADDIVSVLASEGENRIAVGSGSSIGDAFKDAIAKLGCSIYKVNSLLIDFCYGTKQPVVSEFSVAQSAMTDANPDLDVVWGVVCDESLGESCKVILVASVIP